MSPPRGLPRYRAVLDHLRSEIAAGAFPAGRLPAEPDLARRVGVSRMTLRRALAALAEEGVLVARQGMGTFVRAPGPDGGAPSDGVVAFLLDPAIPEGGQDPYFLGAIQHLTARCAATGRALLVLQDPDALKPPEPRTGGRRLEGVIASAFDTVGVERLRDLRHPLVLLDSAPLTGHWTILPDHAAGIAALVRLLVDLGHRRIAHLAGPPTSLAGRERREAWRTALLAQGLDPTGLEASAGFASEDGHRAMARLWEAPDRPTAVLCANDRAALGAMACLQERGVRIPHDISVVGFDDIDGASLVFPRLTTMAVDRAAMATLALDRLLAPTPSPTEPTVLRVPTRLEFRHSTAVPPHQP